jgi:hypothetical protein
MLAIIQAWISHFMSPTHVYYKKEYKSTNKNGLNG